MAKKIVYTEQPVDAMSTKDAIVLASSTVKPDLTDIVRAMATLTNTIGTCNKAKAALQELLNSFSQADIDAVFKDTVLTCFGKKFSVQHKVDSDMTYSVETLEKIKEAEPYLTTVTAYNKFDKAAYSKDLTLGKVDPKVSSLVNVTLVEHNEFKEVK